MKNTIKYAYDETNKCPLIEFDEVARYIKRISKKAIDNYKQMRQERMNELMDYGEDIDVRFEQEWTRYTAKNMEVLSKFIVDDFEKMKREIESMRRKNGRRKS